MRKLTSILLLLAVSCALEVRAGSVTAGQAGSHPAKASGAEPKLQLTTDIVERRQYPPNYVGLKLRLTFKNIGGAPVILDRTCLLVRRLVSRDPEARAAKKYESEVNFDYMGGIALPDTPSDMSHFVTLKPGESYAFDMGVGSFAVYGGEGEPPKGQLGSGTHYLQLTVSTWSYLTDPAPFRRKWEGQGFLWYEGLTSQPMPFTVEIER